MAQIHIPPKLCVHVHVGVFNHITNGLVEKMMDDLMSKKIYSFSTLLYNCITLTVQLY